MVQINKLNQKNIFIRTIQREEDILDDDVEVAGAKNRAQCTMRCVTNLSLTFIFIFSLLDIYIAFFRIQLQIRIRSKTMCTLQPPPSSSSVAKRKHFFIYFTRYTLGAKKIFACYCFL